MNRSLGTSDLEARMVVIIALLLGLIVMATVITPMVMT